MQIKKCASFQTSIAETTGDFYMAQWILAKPTMADEQDAAAFVAEYAAAGKMPVQGGSGLGTEPFGEWLAHIDRLERGEDLPRGYVPSSCFFLKNTDSPRILGVVSIRWQLTPPLMKAGGNIGYCVRPCEREKGLGSLQLGLAIEKCREKGLKKVLVTCTEENKASAATILSQGGVEEAPSYAFDGTMHRRFWISTGKRIALRTPTLQHKAAAEEMIAEFHANGENMLYGSGGAGDCPYDKWLVKMDRYANAAPPENVPQFVRFGVMLPEERLIGYVALRPQLNETLLRIGGNIGYCVRPGARGEGVGHAQLGMALAWLRERGAEQALLTCSESNKASAATILSQGGVEQPTFVDELGIPHRRFHVPTADRLILVRPGPEDEGRVRLMLADFAKHGEEFICGSSGANRLPFALWLEKIAKAEHRENLSADRMPQYTYISVLMPENKPVGFVAIRPELNDALRREAGNIGYSVRPSMRRMGYGKAQLQAALRNIGERGVQSALLTCDADNIASAATMLSCGGVEDTPSLAADGKTQRRFRISLPAPGYME